MGTKLTPSASIRVVYRRVHVAKVDLAHKAIDLRHASKSVRVAGNVDGERSAA